MYSKLPKAGVSLDTGTGGLAKRDALDGSAPELEPNCDGLD